MRSKFNKPLFFPDATRAVLKTVDSLDIKNTKTPGVLVNTFHVHKEVGEEIINLHGGVKKFMNWEGLVISDSGGFQVMSIVKKFNKGNITNHGVEFVSQDSQKVVLTPEDSIRIQFSLKTDLMVVLDDFTDINASRKIASQTVERTLLWAKRSKIEYEKQMIINKITPRKRPLLIGVVQGGKYLDLRKYCLEKLVEIGFDGLGYGGWPIKQDGTFDYEVAKVIAANSPKGYLLYGLGVGKPHEIVALHKMGFTVFDCVLPTRDARHGRLYVFNADKAEDINVDKKDFYSYYVPKKAVNSLSKKPVSSSCDCLLCTNYSRSYFYHLWKIKDITALRLATIHNLRFYSMLMERLT